MTLTSAPPRLDPTRHLYADGAWRDLEGLRRHNRMYDAVIDEVHGRRIRIGDHWLSDFASCNYLGFDLDPEIVESVHEQLMRWGTHPSWSRLLGNPRPYIDIEERLTALLHAEDTLVLPTITHIHMTVIPILAARGHVLMDAQAHKTIYDGCAVARGRGARLHRFRSGDVADVEQQLSALPQGEPRLVCMDGVNSMTGNVPDVQAFADVCRRHDAVLYIDDAHGFGVIGEMPSPSTPYGLRGNSIMRYAKESYDNVVLVGGFSKAYSSLLAFLALPTRLKNHLKVAASPYLYSGPSPTASLATVLSGFTVNEVRGDRIRHSLAKKSRAILQNVHELGLKTPNVTGFPIIEIPLADADDLPAVGDFLFDQGIYVTLAAYPLVPRDQVGFRIQVTAANEDDEIDELNQALKAVAGRFELQLAR